MNISIIGCGWLGMDLAKTLKSTHTVYCYQRRQQPLEEELIGAYLPRANDPFWQSEYFVLSLSTKDDYLESIKNFLELIPQKSTLLLMSSTSVYLGYNETVDETYPVLHTSLSFEAEQLVQTVHPHVIILRLGGLMGEDRIAGQWQNSTRTYPDGPVNYVHKEDLLKIIPQSFSLEPGIYNVVAPLHPLRSEVHAKNARHFGYAPKTFESTSKRLVNGEKLVRALDYRFMRPDPLGFWDDLCAD